MIDAIDSVRIEGYSFGRIRIDGVDYTKDVIILFGSRNETQTDDRVSVHSRCGTD